jgi:hypothetical protein
MVRCPIEPDAHQFDVKVRRDWLLAEARDQLATASTIAGALTTLDMPVTKQQISSWKCDRWGRSRLAAYPSITGHALFKVGDVMDLVAQSAARMASRRLSA